MTSRILRRLTGVGMQSRVLRQSALAAACFGLILWAPGGRAAAQPQEQTHIAGTFGDHVWVEGSGAGAGAWQVTGEWRVKLRGASGTGDFVGSILGVRSDLWVQQTNANPANPAARSPHTHHVGLFDARLTVLPNGVRLTGTAVITVNGAAAPYSGAPVQVDITGGGLVTFSNLALTFFGAAVDHFGPQPYDGVVVVER
jgi:hypothetical protein